MRDMARSDYSFSGMKALVIDDQAFVRRIVIGLLRQMGFHSVEEAEDGAEGLKLNNTILPDVIVCDIEMEPVDGLTFLQILRNSKDVQNQGVPVVFLTNHTESGVVKRGRELGANSFVVKPPSLGALKERIVFAVFRHQHHETT